MKNNFKKSRFKNLFIVEDLNDLLAFFSKFNLHRVSQQNELITQTFWLKGIKDSQPRNNKYIPVSRFSKKVKLIFFEMLKQTI